MHSTARIASRFFRVMLLSLPTSRSFTSCWVIVDAPPPPVSRWVRSENAARAIPMTVSAGVVEWRQAGETPADLLRRADDALYVAKRGGRNRVVSGVQPVANPAAAGAARRDEG